MFPGVYVWDNVILSGTHTHSTPGGVGGTALVDITTFGFIRHNFDAIVNGVVAAIAQATGNIRPGVIKVCSLFCLFYSNASWSPLISVIFSFFLARRLLRVSWTVPTSTVRRPLT
jgi:hypothetical protein